MIYSVEKRTKRKNGKLVESQNYYLRYRVGDMPTDKWKSTGFPEKSAAESWAADFFKRLQHEMAGIAPPRELIEGAQLRLCSLIDEYCREMSVRGKDEKYVHGTKTRLEKVMRECGWRILRDITAESFKRWRREQDMKAKTLNDYLSDLNTFLKEQVKSMRLQINPLVSVSKIDRKEEEEEVRRAFTVAEFKRLLASSGPRALLYELTMCAGLRRGEVGKVTWGDLQRHRNGKAKLHLRPSITKNKKEAFQTLNDQLYEKLLAKKPAQAKLSDRIFPVLPRMPRFFKDLEAAGIEPVDERGHHIKFHSLRHTLGTWLWLTGTNPRSIQEIMRLSDMKMVERYTDPGRLDTEEAIAKLPDLDELDQGVSQIGAQISDKSGPNVSQVDETSPEKFTLQHAVNECVSRALAGVVAVGRMVRAAGFEPATPSV